MKEVSLPIREFAMPAPRKGSIEANSGYGRQLEGQEIHQRVQEIRSEDHSSYEAEVRIERAFERGGFRFVVGGRMDGLFRTDPPKIEEIKSSFNACELSKKISESGMEHPYWLQLATYGYFYWLEHQVMPKLSFHLVSTRDGESEDLEIQLDAAKYEA